MTRKNKKTNETAVPVEPPVSFTEEQTKEQTREVPFFVGTEPEETKKLEDFPSTTILSAEVSNDVIITKKAEENWIAKGINDIPSKESRDLAENIMKESGGKFPTERVKGILTPVEGDEVMQVPSGAEGKPFVSTKQDMKNPTDPFIVERYEINRIIRKYADTMQKVIRDPNKTLSEVTPQLFDLMVKEYGYLHSFLETSHNFIRLRAEQLGSQNYAIEG